MAAHPAAPGPGPILRVAQVSKVYPGRFGRPPLEAVHGVSFDVAPGEILGLLGPNGAGKTTTLKMITGLLRPTDGQVTISGLDVARHRSRAVRELGAVLEGNRNLHWKLTAFENLRYFGALKGVTELRQRADAVIERLGLGPHREKRVGELSRGLQQRVAIAVALLGRPRVMVLDEPTLGLDVLAASAFKDVVRAIAQDGCAIVLTTHQMEVAQALSDRIAIIAGGRLAALDALEALRRAYRAPGYEVVVRHAVPPDLAQALADLGARDLTRSGALATFRLPEGEGETLYRVFDPLREHGAELVSVRQLEIDLEGVYRRIVGGEGGAR